MAKFYISDICMACIIFLDFYVNPCYDAMICPKYKESRLFANIFPISLINYVCLTFLFELCINSLISSWYIFNFVKLQILYNGKQSRWQWKKWRDGKIRWWVEKELERACLTCWSVWARVWCPHMGLVWSKAHQTA